MTRSRWSSRSDRTTLADVGLLGLRVGVGATLFAHGAQKLLGWFGGGGPEKTGQAFGGMGFVPGGRNALLAGASEAGSGALLALGLATGPAGAVAAGTMTVAGSVHRPNGFFNTEGGLEHPATLGLVGSALSLTGPGRLSLDHVTGDALNRPWMRVVAFVGAVGSAAYLISQRSTELGQRSAAETD